MGDGVPTVYEWAGGQDAFERLTVAFYARVREDELLAPVFADMPDDHPHNVAVWLAEVFGGPSAYTEEHGGYHHMMTKHLGLAITEERRARWAQLIGIAADDAGPAVRPGVPLGVHGLHRVGHAHRPCQLPTRRRAAARGAGAALGLGRGASVAGLASGWWQPRSAAPGSCSTA